MSNKRTHRNGRSERERSVICEFLESRQLLSASSLTAEPLGTAVTPETPFTTGYATVPVGAYTPTQIRTAYGVSSISFNGVSGTGAGQTIAIITAYDNPKLVDSSSSAFSTSDLHMFDVAMGIADPPSFIKVDENGHTNYPSVPPASDPGWANESDLDVEWAHAMAPQANIILVEAYYPSLSDLLGTAVQYVRQVAGVSVISMSFAQSEDSGNSSYDSYLQTPSGHAGITFVAASGDLGDEGGYPASSPNVLSVGATTLTLTSSNTISSEVGRSTSGGEISAYEAKPAYQVSVTQSSTKRTTPDVSFEGGSEHTGVAVYDSYDGGTSLPWYILGGTSAGAPAWAGLIAVADQGRAKLSLGSLDGVSQTLPRLYELNSSDYHDITSGNNGYAAGTGYDLVTGLGSPVADKLVPDLAGGNSVTGTIFNDVNGNGSQDSGDAGLVGWGTFVDLYDVGYDKGLDTQVYTNSSGVYQFSDLPGGTYRFNLFEPTGYKKTTAAYYTITLGYGSKLTGYNIGNQPTTVVTPTGNGAIAGYVFADTNDNGVWNSTEKGVAGATVYIDKNNDGKDDTGDTVLTTSSTGYYDFTGLGNATYVVREVLTSGQAISSPTSGYYSVTISNAYNATGKNFGITGSIVVVPPPPGTGSIAGYAFADANSNGVWNSGEAGLAGVTVYIDANNDGKEDTGDTMLTTSSAGYFDFTGLANGTYVIREVIPSGKKLTTPTSAFYSVTISNSYNATGKNFGNATA